MTSQPRLRKHHFEANKLYIHINNLTLINLILILHLIQYKKNIQIY